MILVTVELLPFGDLTQRKHLGTARIANDATGTATVGNYSFTLSLQHQDKAWRVGRIVGFPRQRRNAWELLLRCLETALRLRGEQSPPKAAN